MSEQWRRIGYIAGGLVFGLALYAFVFAISHHVVGPMHGGLGDVAPQREVVYPRF